MKIYRLYINSDGTKETYNLISNCLGVTPVVPDKNEDYNLWTYEVIENENESYYDFIKSFTEILDGNFEQLATLGINRTDIDIWLLYEYEHQCSLGFDPMELKQLSNLGVSFCIDCWEK